MPTYRNTSNHTIIVNDIVFLPYGEKAVKKVLRHPLLVKVSDEPFIRLALETEVSGQNGEVVSLDIEEGINTVEIINIFGKVQITVNSSDNPYRRTLEAGDFYRLSNIDGKVEKLILIFLEQSLVRVVQLEED